MKEIGWNTMVFFETATLESVLAHLDEGADPKEQDQWGYTPLHFAAAFNDDPDIITALLDAGADIEARDKEWGATPLHWAAWSNNNPAIVIALLDGGADLNVRDEADSTPLHAAAEHSNNPEVIAMLLDAGADVHARDMGKLPRDYAKDNAAIKDSEVYDRLSG